MLAEKTLWPGIASGLRSFTSLGQIICRKVKNKPPERIQSIFEIQFGEALSPRSSFIRSKPQKRRTDVTRPTNGHIR